jgi:hypothetical protein
VEPHGNSLQADRWLHQQQQQQQQAMPRAMEQDGVQQDVEMDEGEELGMAARATGTSGADSTAAGAQPQGGLAKLLPKDPFEDRHSSAAWERLQQEYMLRDATELIEEEAEEPAALRLSEQDKQRLQVAFSRDFAAQLQQQECPAGKQVRAWLRQQLDIAELSYDDGYDDDAAPYGDQQQHGAALDSPRTKQPQQQQQQQLHRWGQQSQQQRGDGVRRSQRSSKGQLSFNYAALFGTSTQRQQMAVTAAAGGGAGQGGTGARIAHLLSLF